METKIENHRYVFNLQFVFNQIEKGKKGKSWYASFAVFIETCSKTMEIDITNSISLKLYPSTMYFL